MLKALRKKGVAKKILWIVAIIVIISFGFFGGASLLDNNSANYIGTLFGKKISINDFEKAYKQIQLQAMIFYGEDFKTLNTMINFEAETWNRLILLHEAKRKKIKVSDEEVVNTIEQYPFFHRDGKFDSLLYNNALNYAFRIKPRDFEESIRNTIKISKLKDMQTSHVTLTESEIFQNYQRQNEKTQISYVLINSSLFMDDVTIDEAYLKKYYTEHKSNFLQPPTIKVDYVKIPFPEALPVESKSEEESEEESDDSLFEAYQKAAEIYQIIRKGTDFDVAAEKNRLTIETTNYFSLEKPLFIFGSFEALNKIFKLGLREVSEPLETDEGIFLVRMKDKKDAYVPDFKEVYEQVKLEVKNNEAKRIAKLRAEEYLKKIQSEISAENPFSEIIKGLNLEAYQTPLFTRGQYLPIVGLEKNFQETAFQLTPDQRLSEVVEIAKGYCLLYLDNYIPVEETKYLEEKEGFEENLLMEKKMQTFNDYFAKLKAEANLTSNLRIKE